MDISIAGIEEQWQVAQAHANTPQETAALQRAQILATLLAAGIGQHEPLDIDVSTQGLPVTDPQAMIIGDPTDDDFFAEAKAARRRK